MSGTSIHRWRRRWWCWGRRTCLVATLLFEKFDDEILIVLNEIIGKPLLGQKVAKVCPPVGVICLKLGKL
jgi:hypothetical protein